MKKIFTLWMLATMMVAGKSYAQNSLVATLEHEGTTTVFSGAEAFKAAHEAADHGDVITLSSGMFQATDITKAVKVYGTGIVSDSVSVATQINGDFTIDIPDTVTTERLSVMGVFFNNNTINCKYLVGAEFLKCRLWRFETNDGGIINDVFFVHCRINNNIVNKAISGSAFIRNSYVNDISNRVDGTSYFDCQNSVIRCSTFHYDTGSSWIFRSSFLNCFIYIKCSHYGNSNDNPFNRLSAPNTAISCVGYTPYSCTLFQTLDTSTDIQVESLDAVFKTWTNNWDATYSETETYELTDEAKTKYLGNDGTQIGIYGGSVPYDPIPSNPQIKSMEVASKPVNGKLKVQVELK